MLLFESSFVKVTQRILELQTQTVGSTPRWLQFTKGHNSVNSIDGVMLLNLYTSSDDALYLYQDTFSGYAKSYCLEL